MDSNAASAKVGDSKPRPVGIGAACLALLTSVLWAGTPVAIKYSTDDGLPPVAVAAIRFAIAAAFMVFWCRLEKTELRLRVGQFGPPLVAGVLLFVQISLFNIGVHWSNASHGTMLINTFVFWIAAMEHFVTRADRLSRRKIAGLAIAAAAVVLVLAVSSRGANQIEPDAPSLIGDAALALSAIVLAAKLIVVKQGLRIVEPGKLVLWHDVVGVALFVLYSLLFENVTANSFTLPAIGGLLYQGLLVAGLCFALQALLMRRHSATQIAVFSFTTPLFGIAIAAVFRSDPLSPWLLAAGALVAAGIYLVNVAPRKTITTSR